MLAEIVGHAHAGEDAHGGVVFCADLIPGRSWVHVPITMGYDRNAELLIDEKRQFLEDKLARNVRLFFTHDPQVALAQLGRDDKGRFVTLHEQGELKARALLMAEPSVGSALHHASLRRLQAAAHEGLARIAGQLLRACVSVAFAHAFLLRIDRLGFGGMTAEAGALRALVGIPFKPLFLAEHSAMRCCCGVVALAVRGRPTSRTAASRKEAFIGSSKRWRVRGAFASDR